jgi:hypothetical protein
LPLANPLEHRQQPILIETPVPKVRVGVRAQLELAALLGGRRVDPFRGQPMEMVVTLVRIHDVNRPVTAVEPLPDQRQ